MNFDDFGSGLYGYDTRFYGVEFTYSSFKGMPYQRLGNSGLQVSRMGLGTWKMGYPERGDGARVDKGKSLAILDRALELGVTFWDTANRYNESSGNSERVIGEWFSGHPGERRNIVLATKCFGAMDGITPNHCGLSRANILDSVYASLDRLQLDRVDLLLFHSYDDETPIEESLNAVAALMAKDQVRYFGVSNFTVEQLARYREVAEKHRLPSVQAVENRFDPLSGEVDSSKGVLAYCAEHGLSFLPYSPLKRGLLTNRYLKGKQVGAGDRLVDEGALEAMTQGKVYETLARLDQLAQAEGLTIAQLSLAYTAQLPGMGSPIPSASSVAQLEENALAGVIQLREETLKELHSLFVT
ncbi:MAG: aldo/keto reductase [Candidatus Latescibacteria bacterium]|nr:aldo/keto reductase [Candidatus Latescibacterota bacterium]